MTDLEWRAPTGVTRTVAALDPDARRLPCARPSCTCNYRGIPPAGDPTAGGRLPPRTGGGSPFSRGPGALAVRTPWRGASTRTPVRWSPAVQVGLVSRAGGGGRSGPMALPFDLWSDTPSTKATATTATMEPIIARSPGRSACTEQGGRAEAGDRPTRGREAKLAHTLKTSGPAGCDGVFAPPGARAWSCRFRRATIRECAIHAPGVRGRGHRRRPAAVPPGRRRNRPRRIPRAPRFGVQAARLLPGDRGHRCPPLPRRRAGRLGRRPGGHRGLLPSRADRHRNGLRGRLPSGSEPREHPHGESSSAPRRFRWSRRPINWP